MKSMACAVSMTEACHVRSRIWLDATTSIPVCRSSSTRARTGSSCPYRRDRWRPRRRGSLELKQATVLAGWECRAVGSCSRPWARQPDCSSSTRARRRAARRRVRDRRRGRSSSRPRHRPTPVPRRARSAGRRRSSTCRPTSSTTSSCPRDRTSGAVSPTRTAARPSNGTASASTIGWRSCSSAATPRWSCCPRCRSSATRTRCRST